MEATLNRKEFFQTVLVSIDADKIEDIIDAYHFAKAFHRDQKREAGGRYFVYLSL
jgi:(p)ppGpp synthase/HD superfamily hydrolase